MLGWIAGFASINHRLSPYPNHPTHPTRRSPIKPDEPDQSTESRLEGRNVQHPQHRDDVLAALRWLRDVYKIGRDEHGNGYRYILVGHSCGATLAFQAYQKMRRHSLLPPDALVGVAGIYDIGQFAHVHANEPVYRVILTNAFRVVEPDTYERVWARKSPVRWVEEDCFGDGDRGLRLVILAHSREDGLVEYEQADNMADLVYDLMKETGRGVDYPLMDIDGRHDECWMNGQQMARVIEAAISESMIHEDPPED